MLKTILLCVTCSAVSVATVIVYSGRTVHSAPFQMDIPYGSAIKMTPDPANIWSWHHEFQNVAPQSAPVTANVLVDFDGNGVMDTENSWLRVVVTDLELVSPGYAGGIAWISDGTGKRYSIGVTGGNTFGGSMPAPVTHISLTTPIVLPVGSPLQVSVQNTISNPPQTFEVNLIGRIVNL